jgi:hypothetical protein
MRLMYAAKKSLAFQLINTANPCVTATNTVNPSPYMAVYG